jgi:hypothetical protein
MTYGDRGSGTPFDQEKLELVREFLRREFRGCQLRDYFEFDKTAQVFLVATDRNVRHTLVIPRDTFRDSDFTRLLNPQLVTALKLSGSLRLTLTPQAPKSRDREYSARFLKLRRRVTDRARVTFVRRPLVCSAAMLSLGFGACMLISSLVWDVRDPQQQVSEWRLVRTATPSDQPQSAVPAGPVSASVTEQTCPEERPVVGARRTASTEGPATRGPGRRDRNLSSNVAASIAGSHDRTRRPQADPVDALRRLVGYIPRIQLGEAMVRWVAAPPDDPQALRRKPAAPQSL